MQYFPGLHNTPILQPTYNTQHSTVPLHNMQHTVVKCDISQLCIMLQYCSPTCNTQCNTILQPNNFIGSSWLVSRQNNGNDNKTQVMLNSVKCNISQLCMMLMLVFLLSLVLIMCHICFDNAMLI